MNMMNMLVGISPMYPYPAGGFMGPPT